MAVQEDIKKLKKAPQDVPSKRIPETNSSDQETSSNSEEEVCKVLSAFEFFNVICN